MRPKEDKVITNCPVARAFTVMINKSPKTQSEICRESGFAKSNIITMIKQGRTPLPLARIPALCNACGVDSFPLLSLALVTYQPEIAEVLESNVEADLFGTALRLSSAVITEDRASLACQGEVR